VRVSFVRKGKAERNFRIVFLRCSIHSRQGLTGRSGLRSAAAGEDSGGRGGAPNRRCRASAGGWAVPDCSLANMARRGSIHG
jgi:hypothetical protein